MNPKKIAPLPRMSRQRREVLDNLAHHPVFRSAQQIHASLADSGSSTGLATVYRNLQVLEESGQVDALRSPGGEMLYRSCHVEEHHHHLVCTKCGRAQEVELDRMEQVIQDLAKKYGYELLDHTLELVGLCPQCRSAVEVEN